MNWELEAAYWELISLWIAPTSYAHHTIHPTIQKQDAEETLAHVLGSLSEVRRIWKAKTRDDSRRKCYSQ
jgi:hypothetical protein